MPVPPIEYLLDASRKSLQDLEIAARNRAANIAKNIKHELEMWEEQSVEADVASWFLEHREELLRARALEVKPHKVEFFDRGEKKSA